MGRELKALSAAHLSSMAFCAGPVLPIGGCTQRSSPRSTVRASLDDLLVVGAGALGVRAARLWRDVHPNASISCATWTDKHHDLIEEEGFKPALASDLGGAFANVLFCAPPSRAGDEYPDCVAKAGSLASNSFVYTSSTAVYKDNPQVTETSELNSSARAQRLLDVEERARGAGGSIVRLGGLYDSTRGPHAVWLRKGKCTGCEDGLLNMVHYDDAAAAAIAALKVGGSDTYVAVDGTPITRLGICESARVHFRFDHLPIPEFGDGMKSVKVIDCSWSMEKLGWKPQFPSFEQFMREENEALMNDRDQLGMRIPECEMAERADVSGASFKIMIPSNV